MKRSVAALAGLIETTGLGTSHIHLRINAAQLNNAFRAFVHEPWTRDLTERQAMAPHRRYDPRREARNGQFRLAGARNRDRHPPVRAVAQIQKHIDRDTPIRFLIAECESPATVLIAVFFAKLFGVENIVDISPLFETPSGLDNGARFVERLLEEEAYRDYVRGRGRLSVQTGFSDAGRFIGQIPATLPIERLLPRPRRSHGASADLGGVEMLIFSTHGESMGRGAHPGDLNTRLALRVPDEARRRFADADVDLKHETSFQGGDGYHVLRQPRADHPRAGDHRHGRRHRPPKSRTRSMTTESEPRLAAAAARLTSRTCLRIRAIAPCSAPLARTCCSRPARGR